MKCDNIQTLRDPYLDSELDARTTLEIEQHLAACAACDRLFTAEEKLEARLTAVLNQGPRTVVLWEQIERELAVASPASRLHPPARASQPVGALGVFGTLSAQLRAGWQTSRPAWAGLAVVWLVIAALNFTAHDPSAQPVAAHPAPSVSEMRFALKQKHLLIAELAATSEAAPADRPKTVLPGPRSDRRNETLNV